MDISANAASYWKGRILLSLSCFPKDSPSLTHPDKPFPIAPSELKQISMGNATWQLIVSLYYGFSFPASSQKYSIRVRWADRELSFDEGKIEKGVLKWYLSKSLICDFPYKEEELPDVILYLCQGTEMLCFIRLPISTMESNPRLYAFTPDKSLELKKPIRKHQAGFIKAGFQLSASQISGEKGVKGISKALEEKKLVSGTLVSHVYMAQDLIPADSNGTSDPFYKICFYGQEVKGETINKSLNPVRKLFYYIMWYSLIGLV